MVDAEGVGVACDRPMSANATVAKVVTQWSTEIRRSLLAKLFRCRSLSRIDWRSSHGCEMTRSKLLTPSCVDVDIVRIASLHDGKLTWE